MNQVEMVRMGGMSVGFSDRGEEGLARMNAHCNGGPAVATGREITSIEDRLAVAHDCVGAAHNALSDLMFLLGPFLVPAKTAADGPNDAVPAQLCSDVVAAINTIIGDVQHLRARIEELNHRFR